MLQIQGVSKQFRNPVLDDINFTLKAGEIVALAGRNGCGKSTLLSIIASVLKPDKGEILVGEDETIAYVPQENALFDELTVKDNLRFWAAVGKILDPKVYFVQDLLTKKVKELSGGMKKRVSIAVALLSSPRYLILDEPSASLDIVVRNEIFTLLSELKTQGHGILFSSHEVVELYEVDQLYIMDSGHFAFQGKPKELGDNIEKFEAELFRYMQ